MRIEFERSGGIAGISLKTSVDTSQLPPAEAAQLEQLVHAADLALLRPRPPGPGADRFQYDLTIWEGKRRQRVSLSETQLTPELRPLIELLLDRARR